MDYQTGMRFNMVKFETAMIWICPNCKAEFRDDSDCDDHIIDAHTESPITKTKQIYKCEGCLQEFTKLQDATKCEGEHEEKNDFQYQALLHQRELDKLLEAGNHPAQKKLVI